MELCFWRMCAAHGWGWWCSNYACLHVALQGNRADFADPVVGPQATAMDDNELCNAHVHVHTHVHVWMHAQRGAENSKSAAGHSNRWLHARLRVPDD